MAMKDDVRHERDQLVGVLETLAPGQWEQSSLCTDWNVREVVAHLVSYDRTNCIAFVLLFTATGFSVGRTNAVLVRRWQRQPSDRLLVALRRGPSGAGVTRMLGHRLALIDSFVHQQDIRRPLRLSRSVPPERLARLAEIMTRDRVGAGGKNRARGLRLQATDVDWATGTGPEVRGPAEAIIMALAGRSAALHDLGGAGIAEMARRMNAGPQPPIQ
jgi:uncharacterized protein (TIGR03083 family)